MDHHVALTLLFGGLALCCNFFYFWEAARCAARDRCAPMTVWATAVFLAHDGSYLVNAHRWFSTYDHWFPILFWVALIVTTGFDLVFLAQTARYGRSEIAPRLSQRAYELVLAGAVVAAIAIWTVVKRSLDDPMYLTSFTITIALCLPSATTLLLRRGGGRGQSVRQYVAFTGMASAWFACNMLVFGPAFKGFPYVALFVLIVVWGVGQTSALHRAQGPSSVSSEAAVPCSTPEPISVA